jgi:hypothetical protein
MAIPKYFMSDFVNHQRVRVTGGLGIQNEYIAFGFLTGKTLKDDPEMIEVYLDSGSLHYYLQSQIRNC